jgi:Flp pilus assembly CpaE family ATPase
LPYDRIMPVLNRFPQRGGLERKVVEGALGIKMAATIADESRLITYSVNRGIAVIESHHRSKPARAFNNLARDLVKGT